MNLTTIEWLRTYLPDGSFAKGVSVNPIRARDRESGDVGHYCELASPGCGECYSSNFQPRFGLPKFAGPKQREERLARLELWLDWEVLGQVVRRKKATKIFWEDMSDLFGAWVSKYWIDACFATMALTPQHTHVLLTKHPDRVGLYLADLDRRVEAWDDGEGEHEEFLVTAACDAEDSRLADPCMDWLAKYNARHLGWPLPHVLVGATVCNQAEASKWQPYMYALADAGWQTWVSYEPALGPVNWTGWEFLRGIVSGGESGHRKSVRPSHRDWHRGTRDFCAVQGIAYHFKQWGAWAPHAKPPQRGVNTGAGLFLKPDGHLGCQGDFWDGLAQAVDRVGKKAAGRLLDGVEHNEFPSLGEVRA